MPGKIIIQFTEFASGVETKISTSTAGTELENMAARAFKENVVALFRELLEEADIELKDGKE